MVERSFPHQGDFHRYLKYSFYTRNFYLLNITLFSYFCGLRHEMQAQNQMVEDNINM